MLDTSARLLRLLSILQTRPEWTGPELAERLDVTVRTLRRDVARLRDLGYPVRATPGVAGGYRLAAGSTLPPLLLDDDEAVAVVLSLRTATNHSVTGIAETALRALAKLERVLPVRLRQRTAALRLATVPLAGPAPTVDPDVLTVIAEACQDLRRLTFGYRDREGAGERTHGGAAPVGAHRPSLVPRGPRQRPRRLAYLPRRPDRRPAADRGSDSPPTTRPTRRPSSPKSVTAAPYRFRARVQVRAPAHVVAESFPPTTGIVEAVDQRHAVCSSPARTR